MGGGQKGLLIKIRYTYPAMIKLETGFFYPKKIQNVSKSCKTSLDL